MIWMAGIASAAIKFFLLATLRLRGWLSLYFVEIHKVIAFVTRTTVVRIRIYLRKRQQIIWLRNDFVHVRVAFSDFRGEFLRSKPFASTVVRFILCVNWR